MTYTHEELLGHTRLPVSLAEIVLFVVIIYLLVGDGGKWRMWLGCLLMVYWFVLVGGKFWPAPKFEVPESPLTTRTLARESLRRYS